LDVQDLHGAAMAGSYGEEMKQHFLLEEGWTFLNHGAFGSPLAGAFEVCRVMQALCHSL